MYLFCPRKYPGDLIENNFDPNNTCHGFFKWIDTCYTLDISTYTYTNTYLNPRHPKLYEQSILCLESIRLSTQQADCNPSKPL